METKPKHAWLFTRTCANCGRAFGADNAMHEACSRECLAIILPQREAIQEDHERRVGYCPSTTAERQAAYDALCAAMPVHPSPIPDGPYDSAEELGETIEACEHLGLFDEADPTITAASLAAVGHSNVWPRDLISALAFGQVRRRVFNGGQSINA